MVPQTPISTRYESRLDPSNVRNYGRLVAELAATVPDGLVVFFVSYSYMDYVISRWGGIPANGRAQATPRHDRKRPATAHALAPSAPALLCHRGVAIRPRWHDMGLLREISAHKLIFIETQVMRLCVFSRGRVLKGRLG
jgi:hypothetical protein